MRTLKFRLRPVWLLVAVLGAIVFMGYPLITLVAFGLSNGLDVSSMIRHSFTEPEIGEVVDETEVPFASYPVTWQGHLENPELNECSGMAFSPREPDLIWAHNDSGGLPRLYALNSRGEDLGYIDVDVKRTGDWEDLAAFERDGKSYLLIADVGDNYRWRPEVYLHVVPEPNLADLQNRSAVKPAWTITLNYPGDFSGDDPGDHTSGYWDVESVAVDAMENKVYLLSKRSVPQVLFSVPLEPREGRVTADMETEVRGIPQPNARDLIEDRKNGRYRSQPTAMDILGDRAVVVTYKDGYLFTRAEGQTWAEAFSGVPTRIELPNVFGREAAALDPRSNRLLVAAERRSAEAVSVFAIELAPD